MKFFSKRLAVLLLSLICVISIAGVLSGCKSCTGCGKSKPVDTDDKYTARKVAPTDGSTPMDYSAQDNAAFMAYVLDSQPFYHAYAHNSTKAMAGYEQITQTWKDFKSAEQTGDGVSVMISSDLSYSMFVKSSAQYCFINDAEALRRTGNKPGQSTAATSVEWSQDVPSYYTKEEFLPVYGQFSTELSVYVINPSTIESADSVVDNGDGTYTQKYYLKEEAGLWYQYVMKTNGGLKTVPEFKRIEISFTFDSNWRVLSSYCEEKIKIAPTALGGMPTDSNSKTTTTYDYTEEGFDSVHYGYYENFFKQYAKERPTHPNEGGSKTPEILDVLGGAFGKVISESGQQFDLDVNLGENEYNGKIYLKLADLTDILNSIDVRASIAKSGSGQQDLYLEFNGGAINAYYSDGFAVTANLSEVQSAVKLITDWLGALNGSSGGETPDEPSDQPSSGSSFDADSLLKALDFSYTDALVTVAIDSDDLLGLGIGLNAVMQFNRYIDEEGYSTYEFVELTLNSITYKSTPVELSLSLKPDAGDAVISHDKSQTPFDLADFIGSVYELLDSPVYKVALSLDGSSDLSYINGLVLGATAYVKPENSFKTISASVDIDVSYSGISALLNVYYTLDMQSGGYGDVYITLLKLNEADVLAKVSCNVNDLIETISSIIGSFGGNAGAQLLSEETSGEDVNAIASVINKVISLDFGKIIKELKASEDKFNLTLDVDEILGALGVELGVSFGEVSLGLGKDEGGKAVLDGSVSGLGLAFGLYGSEQTVTAPDSTQFVDIVSFLNGAYELITSDVYAINIGLNGADGGLAQLKNVSANISAYVKLGADLKSVEVYADNITLNYTDVDLITVSVKLNAYYTIAFNGGGFGTVYINITEVTLGGKKIENLDIKVSAEISGAIDAVKSIVNTFKTNGGEKAQAPATTYANVTEYLNYVSIVEQIKTTGNALDVKLDVDGLLGLLGMSDKLGGIKFGSVSLGLGKNESGKTELNGNLPALGLDVNVSSSAQTVAEPDANEYANVNDYLDGVNNLLNGENINSYLVDITLDGKPITIPGGTVIELDGLKLHAPAQVKLSAGFKGAEVYVPITADYVTDEVSLNVQLDAYYTAQFDGFKSGSYGDVYLNLKNLSLNGEAVNLGGQGAKVYCNISELLESIKTLISMFGSDDGVGVAEAQAESAVSDILAKIIALDYAAIINNVTADGTGLNLNVNADKIIENFVDLKGFELGNVELALKAEKQEGAPASITLNGSLEKLGLELALSGSEVEVAAPDKAEYADLATYIEWLKELITSDVYAINIGLNGADGGLAQLKNVSANISAYVKLGADLKSVEVYADNITLNYTDVDLITVSVKLNAYYTIAFNGGGFGTAYINITEVTLGGKKIENLDIKVSAEISGAIDAVKSIVNTFKTNGGEKAQAPATTYANVVEYLNYVSIVEQIKTTGNALDVKLDVDGLLGLLGMSDKLGGIKFGSVSLGLGKNESGKTELNGNLPALGLDVNVSGSAQTVAEPDANEYANVNDYLDGVNNLLNGENIKSYLVDITLDGKPITIPGGTVIELDGLKLHAPAQVKLSAGFKGAEVYVPVTAEYAYKDISLGVQLDAYYTAQFDGFKSGSYGDVYLNLKKVTVNDQTTELDAKVFCNINELVESIKTLISLIRSENGGEENANGAEAQAESAVSGVLAKIIALDYAAIINNVTADGTGLNLNVNADKIIENFVDLKGFELGNVELALKAEKQEGAPASITLNGSLEKLGLELALSGSEVEVVTPDKASYLNLNELMDIVLAAYEQATAIIESEDILFNVEGGLTIDGVTFGVNGKGEVIWQSGKLLAVAAEAELSVSENGAKSNIQLKLIYDDRVEGDSAPLVRFTVGTLGLNIYRSDIDGVTSGAQGLKNAINSLMQLFNKNGSNGSGAESGADGADGVITLPDESGETGEAGENVESGEPAALSENALDIGAIANAVLGELNKFSVTLSGDDNVLKQILVSHANGSLKLSANGALAMQLDVDGILSLNASVRAPEKDGEGKFATGAYTQKLNAGFEDGYEFYGSEEDGKFVKAVYDYLFDVIEGLSIKEILGTNSYKVHIELHGGESAIEALDGVEVVADLYYTEGLTGTVKGTKLVEADVRLDIKGTLIVFNARYAGQTVYIELNQIAGTQLIGADSVNGLKFRADVHDIYDVAEILYNLVTGINFSSDGEEAGTEGGNATDNGAETYADEAEVKQENVLTSLITKLLSLELDGLITHTKVDGENVYTIRADGILQALNINVTLGTLTLTVNPETHKLAVTAALDGSEWLKLNAAVWADANNEHNTLNPDSYLDIGFVKTLISDLGNTLVDEDGNINKLYSFTGTITATLGLSYNGIPVKANIELLNTVLTAGFDENDGFYLTLTATLKDNSLKASFISLGNITSKGDISVTYSNGYITMGRDGQYKVMTLAYFLENLSSKDNSPVQWLLGTNTTILWPIIRGQLPSINSGLSNTDTMYLYDIKRAAEDDGKFFLTSILSGYQAMIDGEQTANYNTVSKAIDALGLDGENNYYVLDVNGNGLTGGTVTSLYAAILRNGKDADGNDVNGISGLRAYAGLMGMINVSVTLDNRTSAHAQDYYKVAMAIAEQKGHTVDFNHSVAKPEQHAVEIFGCYDTSSGQINVNKLDEVIIRLLDTEGNLMVDNNGHNAEYQITYGSKVFLDSVWAPFWSDEERNYTLTYGDKDGNPLNGTPVVVDGVTVGTYIELTDAILGTPDTDEEGNIFYTISLRRIVEGKERKPITYHTGVNGVDEIEAALELNADGETVKLLNYDIGGYVLVGMYRDQAHTLTVSAEEKNAFDGDEVYCLYLIDRYEENGVVYELHATNDGCANCDNVIHYHVKGYNADTILPYTKDLNDGGSVLFIKNEIEINGTKYPVTAINDKAFGYMGNSTEATDTTPGIGAGLKNVVVPENIKYVGALAFTDNHNIKTVVFLADTVTFGGYDKNAPFYGSAEVSDGQYTNLSVYYNKAVSGGSNGDNAAPAWALIRAGTTVTGSLKDKRYIGHNGGTLGSELSGAERYEYSKNDGADRRYTAGYAPMWAYVDFNFAGVNITNTVNLEDLKIAELTSGVNKTALTAERIYELVTVKLNELTCVNGYINAFGVNVSGGVEMNGSRYTVTITVTEKPSSEWYYAFDFGSSVPDCTADYNTADDSISEFNGVTYVLAGSNLALTSAPDADGIYVLEYWVFNGEILPAETTSVEMPEAVTSLKAFWDSPNGFSEITVISEIEFTYHGKTYSSGESTVNAANKTLLGEPEASGYSFLGWATANGASLSVQTTVEITAESNWTLYALWVEAKDNVTFTADGNATVTSNGEGTLYGWYDYNDVAFADPISSDSSYTLTTDRTVVRARMQYTFTISLNAGTTTWGYNYVAGDDYTDFDVKYENKGSWISANWQFTAGTQCGTNNCNYTLSNILEGYSVEVSRKWSNVLLVKINDGTGYIHTYAFKGFKTKSTDIRGIADAYDNNDKHYIVFTSGNWSIVEEELTSVEVENGIGYFNNSGVSQAFGSVSGLKSNLTVYVKS